MIQATSVQPPKTVRIIPATIDTKAAITQNYRQLRVAAYCRVSTKQDEQLNSYEVQRTHYEERIRTEPKWSLVGRTEKHSRSFSLSCCASASSCTTLKSV